MRRDILEHNVVVTVMVRIAEEGGGQEADGGAEFHCGGTWMYRAQCECRTLDDCQSANDVYA